MATIYDVQPNNLIQEAAVQLKSNKKVIAPDWSVFVKTGASRERPPSNPDWWYMRAASMLRKVYTLGPIGTSKLTRHYGGRKNNGMAPDHFMAGSGKIVRTILQQLEKSKLIEQRKEKGKGRIITAEGRSFLDGVAGKLLKK